MGSAEAPVAVDGMLATLRGLETVGQIGGSEIPPSLISARGIGSLLAMSGSQVVNFLSMAKEPRFELPGDKAPYFGWDAIGNLVPPMRYADSSPVGRVKLSQLRVNGEGYRGDPLAYARLLQVLLLPPADLDRVPFDWEDPVNPGVIGLLGSAACEVISARISHRRPLIVAATEAAPAADALAQEATAQLIDGVDSLEVNEREVDGASDEADQITDRGEETADGVPVVTVVTEASAVTDAAKSSRETLQPASAADTGRIVRIEAAEPAREERGTVSVTKIFDRNLLPADLLRLGVDAAGIQQALLAVQNGQAGPLTETVDGVEVYRGVNLQKILITLFGLRTDDAETYLGVRSGLIERYVFGPHYLGRPVFHNAAVWDNVLREFRPDLVEYATLPDRPPQEYGFDDLGALLTFVQAQGGEYELHDGEILLSYPALEMLSMQLGAVSLPSVEDGEHKGWMSLQEMADTRLWSLEDTFRWAQALPTVVGHLNADRKSWFRGRGEPPRVLPHYSPSVVTLFGHVADIQRQERLDEERRIKYYYPRRVRQQGEERSIDNGE